MCGAIVENWCGVEVVALRGVIVVGRGRSTRDVADATNGKVKDEDGEGEIGQISMTTLTQLTTIDQ